MAIEGVPSAATPAVPSSSSVQAPARPQAPPADILPVGLSAPEPSNTAKTEPTPGAPEPQAPAAFGAKSLSGAVGLPADVPVDPATLPPQDPSTRSAMAQAIHAQIDAQRAANQELHDKLVERQAMELQQRIVQLSDVLTLAAARFRVEPTAEQQIDLIA